LFYTQISAFLGCCQAPHFHSRNAAPWHIPFEIINITALISFFSNSIAQEQINYSTSPNEPLLPPASHMTNTETPTSARLSFETGVTIAALLFIALILMRPWLPL
jgi:hypothetical protein